MKPLDMGTTNGSEANNSHMIHFYGLCRNLKLWVIVADGIWTCHNQCHEFPIFSSACCVTKGTHHLQDEGWRQKQIGQFTPFLKCSANFPSYHGLTAFFESSPNILRDIDWSPLNHFCHYHCDLQQTLVAFDFGRSLAQNCRIIWDVDPTIRTNLSIFYSTS